MTDKLREATTQALEAIESLFSGQVDHERAKRCSDAIAALRAALMSVPDGAEPQEPVFWYRPRSDGFYEGPIHNAQIERVRKESGGWTPLYTAPLRRHPPSHRKGCCGNWEEYEMISGNLLIDFLSHSEDFAVCQWDDNIEQWIPIPFKAVREAAEAWDESQKDDYTE